MVLHAYFLDVQVGFPVADVGRLKRVAVMVMAKYL